jgi:hypothetical protein
LSACGEEGNGKGGKSDGNGDKEDNGDGGKSDGNGNKEVLSFERSKVN